MAKKTATKGKNSSMELEAEPVSSATSATSANSATTKKNSNPRVPLNLLQKVVQEESEEDEDPIVDSSPSINQEKEKEKERHAAPTEMSKQFFLSQKEEVSRFDGKKLSPEVQIQLVLGRMEKIETAVVQFKKELQDVEIRLLHSVGGILKELKKLITDPKNSVWWKKDVFAALNKLLITTKFPTQKTTEEVTVMTIRGELIRRSLDENTFWNAIKTVVFQHVKTHRGQWSTAIKKILDSKYHETPLDNRKDLKFYDEDIQEIADQVFKHKINESDLDYVQQRTTAWILNSPMKQDNKKRKISELAEGEVE